MDLRFSRTSLNLIIFTCIILIGWASIDKNRTEKDLAPDDFQIQDNLELPPLAALNQQSWNSQEGIQIIWQSRLDTDFLIRVRGTRGDQRGDQDGVINNQHISWQTNYWQWDLNLGNDFELGLAKLKQSISEFPSHLKSKPATIILQGPWGADIARLTSARIINSLQLKPLEAISSTTESETRFCPWQPVSAQFWLQDQLSNPRLSQADSKNKRWIVQSWPHLAPLNAQSLHTWKQTFVQQWQLNWQNPTTQFDMLADLAYYRLPENYLLQGYWGINALDIPQLEKYLAQCQASHRSI